MLSYISENVVDFSLSKNLSNSSMFSHNFFFIIYDLYTFLKKKRKQSNFFIIYVFVCIKTLQKFCYIFYVFLVMIFFTVLFMILWILLLAFLLLNIILKKKMGLRITKSYMHGLHFGAKTKNIRSRIFKLKFKRKKLLVYKWILNSTT